MREQREILEGHPDPASLRQGTDDRAAADKDIALIRFEHTRDHPQQHRLAAARRPEHRDYLAGLDDERQAVGGSHRAEDLGDGFDFESRHCVSP